jgi:hypothetical protein
MMHNLEVAPQTFPVAIIERDVNPTRLEIAYCRRYLYLKTIPKVFSLLLLWEDIDRRVLFS